MSLEEHKVDVEKMIVKQKYDNCFKENLEDDYPAEHAASAPVQNQPEPSASAKVFVNSNRVKVDSNDFEVK